MHKVSGGAIRYLVEVAHTASHRCLASMKRSHAVIKNLMFRTKLIGSPEKGWTLPLLKSMSAYTDFDAAGEAKVSRGRSARW